MSLLLLLGDQITGASATEPEVRCQIDFDPPAATDVSSDLRGFSFSRGKQRELDRYQAGRGNVVLSNADRKYDPSYSSSPYNGDIKPQRRIRLPINYAGTTHMMIEGYIDSWDQEQRGPHDAVANVSFTDGFKVLNRRTLPRSVYTLEVAADSPSRWYRLDETAGSTTVFDAISSAHGVTIGAPTFGASSLVDRDDGGAMTLDGIVSTGPGFWTDIARFPAAISGTQAFAIEFWVKCAPQTDGAAIFHQGLSILSNFVEVQVRGTGAFLGLVDFRVANLTGLRSTVRVDDNAAHHIVCVRDSSGNCSIYVDGVDRTDGTGVVSMPGSVTTAPMYVGSELGIQAGFTGTIDELAIYGSALSAARIAAHNSAGRTPWTGDLPGARLERVLDAVNWPDSRRDLDTGATTLQGADLGQTALEHAQKVEESEFGQLFVDKHGNVKFVGRVETTNKTAVATITDDSHYQASDPEYTDELIRNEATISRADGVAQTYRDQASIDEYLINSYTRDGLFHDSDALSLYAAQYIVNISKDPQLRIQSLTVMPKHDPATLFPLLLALELGDWITIQETPQNVTPAITHTAVVEGIGLQWSPKSWVFTLNLSPFGTDAIFELDAPASNPGLDFMRLFF